MKNIRKIIAALSAAALVATGVPAMAETVPQEAGQTPQVSAEAAQMVESGEYAEDQVIVVFKDNVTDSRIRKEIREEDASCLEIAEATDSAKAAVAEIGENESVEEAITRLNENDKVLYAQPNYRYKPAEAPGTNDPYNNDEGQNQWYLTNIKAREAWEALSETEGLQPVTVAVIDTGADVSHEDLKGQIHTAAKKIDGADETELKKDSDRGGHGTHTSGLIGAAANNGKGIAGIASGIGNDKIRVMPIDATTSEDGELYFDTFNLVSAISYAKQNGAKVINMSLGGPGPDKVTEEAVEDAYKNGITVVAAAGNEDTDEFMVPSDYGEVISVCNTTRENKRYAGAMYGSNYGQAKDISAPGTSILSTIPGGYTNMTGSSMSSPMVSAAAAVLYSVNPELTPFQVKNILCGTAQDIGEEGFDYYTGYGLLNMEQAVKAAKAASAETKITGISFKEDAGYKKCIKVGESEMLEVLTAPAEALENVSWSSSDESVVKVDENGKITGISAGAAEITCASASGTAASQKVYVSESNLPTKVSITNQEQLENLAVGDMVYLDAEVLPKYADNADVYWKSSDMKVATVDELGCLKVRAAGEARIMAYVGNSKYRSFEALGDASDDLTAVIDISVGEAVSKVSLVDPKTKIKLGTSCVFQATAEPENAVKKDISWYSSNRGVAQIDAKTGKLTAKGVGKATIQARVSSGKSASVRVTVYKTSYSGTSYGLTAASATYKSVKLKWKSIPNADGYDIYRNGKKIKGDVSGTATSWTNTGLKTGTKYSYKIKAYYKVGNKKEYCGFSSVKSAKPALKAASVKTKKGKGKITLTWSKVSGATGYTVYRYSASKKKYVKKKTLKKRTYIDKNVKKGKKYSYKVRAYRTVGGKKIYGPYSKKVSRVYK
ncbi:S8 family serine peptidase [bacterium 210820-DFI.6.37]|nr:S8 family serine peptidase [bacterium 210820-DFI.6.37]